MSPWEFACCVEGYNRSQGAKDHGVKMNDDEYDALCELGDMWSKS